MNLHLRPYNRRANVSGVCLGRPTIGWVATRTAAREDRVKVEASCKTVENLSLVLFLSTNK